MTFVPPLPFPAARKLVVETVRARRRLPAVERVPLLLAANRVLAEPLKADRDSPPLPKAVRDGFALRAADTPGTLDIVAEVAAGTYFPGPLRKGQAVEIMTGAPMPEGADAVAMVEHVERRNGSVHVPQAYEAGANYNPQGCECRAGAELLPAGSRLSYPGIALAASCGYTELTAYLRPRVAIIATGNELVAVEAHPLPHQIRNSNAYSLAAQVDRAGGIPVILPIARDTIEETLDVLEQARGCALILFSGGVSAGKYDVVEPALAALGARIEFDRVLIQPGQPLVFGSLEETFFFGLPGNPASTMVCFEVFARAALELLCGAAETPLPITQAPLARPFQHKAGLTRFLPARMEGDGLLTPLSWSGSSDLAATARANCYLVAEPDRPYYEAGERIGVLLQ
jgi:molybdopterin molybdotransferase